MNADLNLGCSNIRNALYGNDEVFAYIVDKECIFGFVTLYSINLCAVHKDSVIFGFGIAVCDFHREFVVHTVTDRGRTFDGISCRVAQQSDRIQLVDRHSDSHRVARHIRCGDGMRLVIA